LNGRIDGDQVKLRSSLPADGNVLTYAFVGSVSGPGMTGDVQLGEYGRARWRAIRHTTA
jgi:ribosomal protein L2